jgi:hypothetical protein
MALSNVEIADNIIDLLNKVKKNEAFNDTIDKKEQCKLFNKIVKAGIKGQTNINIKTFKKEPNKYNIFIKDMMPSVKKENPTLSSSEIFKIIGALWTKDHPKKAKEPDTKEFKEPNTKEFKEPDNTKESKEPDNTKKSKKVKNK